MLTLQALPEIGHDPDVHRAIESLKTLMSAKAAEHGATVPTFAVLWLTMTDTDYQSACILFGDADPDILDDLAEAMLESESDETFTMARPN